MFNKHFRKYIFKYSIPLLIGIAVLVFIDYVQTNVPIIIGDIINLLDKFDKSEVTEIFAKDELLNLTVSLITVVAITGMGRVFWRLAIFGTSRKIEYGLRNEMFIHATTLSQDYYSEQKVGGLMTYFINDLAAVRMAYGPGIMMLIDSTFLGGFVFYKMFKLNKELTLILIVPIVLLLVAMVIINKSMRKQFKIRQEKFRDLSDYTQENLSGISIVKAYVREAFEIMTFKRKSKELYDTNMKFYKKSVLVEVVTSIIINLIVITIIGFGAYAVVKTANLPDAEKFDVGNFTAYIALFFMLSWPTRALTRVLSIYSQAGASAQRITDFLETKPSVYDKDNLIEPDVFIPEIEVKNLTFRYPDSKFNAIDNMSFKINQGEMVGILGKTGSGKTTLVDLMLRVYNVKHDEILISKTDIMKLPLKLVRDKIGYVPQDNFLFSDTIKNNIAFSDSNLTMEEVINASKLADIYDNVNEFQLGFETILGERGVTVSGGQKQRISIARAIAKNPEILILDDAVSAVDTKTEETIIKNLYDLRKGKTTIFIAHRISTVQNLDKIIVIDEGKVVAVGSHDELLETSEFYRDIVKRQTLEKLAE
ncbi:ABC transporter ATP-binding protein [Haploplasma modicum]|uniref:ABC transporter ATP-binding protein n=1 Tax=Haploplasma modicum TaxID=2150 RepID=UPI00214AFEEE|nr:ABC transporter ATP-binding protein [Haploplasma modicum]MCR1809043.1 ABC transporter ATP-binding protein/permease [Haploplasma modicum]